MFEPIQQLYRRAAAHPGLRRYGVNTCYLMVEKAVRLLFGLLVSVYVARQLGPAQFGQLNYAISFVALFSVVGTLGMDAIIVRELVRRPEKSGALLGSAFLLKTCGFAAMALLLGAVLWFSPLNSGSKLLMAVILAGYAFQTFQVLDFYFQSKVLSRYTVASQLAALVIVSGFRLYFAWNHAPLWCFAAAEAGYMALSAVGYVISYLMAGGCFRRWAIELPVMKYLLVESLPLLLAGAASMVYTRIDQVMITWMLGDDANGQYAAAVRMVEVLLLLPIAVENSFFPSLIGTRATSLRRYYRRTEQLMRAMFYLALMLLVPAALVGWWAIEFLFGPAYRTGAVLFAILTLKILPVYPGLIYGKWYLTENMQKLSLLVSVLGALSNIALNYVLIRRWGVYGAVYATIATTLLVLLVFPLPFRKGRFGIRLFLRALLPRFRE